MGRNFDNQMNNKVQGLIFAPHSRPWKPLLLPGLFVKAQSCSCFTETNTGTSLGTSLMVSLVLPAASPNASAPRHSHFLRILIRRLVVRLFTQRSFTSKLCRNRWIEAEFEECVNPSMEQGEWGVPWLTVNHLLLNESQNIVINNNYDSKKFFLALGAYRRQRLRNLWGLLEDWEFVKTDKILR